MASNSNQIDSEDEVVSRDGEISTIEQIENQYKSDDHSESDVDSDSDSDQEHVVKAKLLDEISATLDKAKSMNKLLKIVINALVFIFNFFWSCKALVLLEKFLSSSNSEALNSTKQKLKNNDEEYEESCDLDPAEILARETVCMLLDSLPC